MRIKRIRIRNFRSFQDESIEFNPYTCLVGPNGAGKSNILCALNVFFRETRNVASNLQQLQEEDFHNKNVGEPVRITVTFANLSPEAQTDFEHYYRQGELTITAEAHFDSQGRRAEVLQHGERLGMEPFREYFGALNAGEPVVKLKAIYAKIRTGFSELPVQGTKDVMTEALRACEAAHPQDCAPIPSPAQFYGFSKGANLLDKHIEWVYVPAVKDVTTEQLEGRENAFGRLVARAVRSKIQFGEDLKKIREAAQVRYQELLSGNASVLEELSKSLQSRVTQWAHPEATLQLKWDQDPAKSITVQEPLVRIIAGEGSFLGDLSRFGHGLQRSYLLALLQELATEATSTGPTLILACEEPELYQHPPQARHLATVLTALTKQDSQVIISTHSPLFVAGDIFEDVRVVRKDSASGASSVGHARYEEVADRLSRARGIAPKKREGMAAVMHRTLQSDLNEIFFANGIVLVEGIEDAAYICSYLHLQGQWDEFRRRGLHIVPSHGKSALLEPVAVLMQLGLPLFVVFDADDSPEQANWRELHRRDNQALLRALGVTNPEPFPEHPFWGSCFVQWPDCLSTAVKAEITEPIWQKCCQSADAEWGHAGNLRKNPLHIATSLRLAWDEGARSPTLAHLCTRILA